MTGPSNGIDCIRTEGHASSVPSGCGKSTGGAVLHRMNPIGRYCALRRVLWTRKFAPEWSCEFARNGLVISEPNPVPIHYEPLPTAAVAGVRSRGSGEVVGTSWFGRLWE